MTSSPTTTTPAPDLLLGLTGRAGSGKDATADYLVQAYGFERAAFADALRDMVETMLIGANVDYAHLYKRALKEAPIPALGGLSARRLMQTLGDWGRALDTDFWVRLLARHTGLDDAPSSTPVHDRIVITDVRFPIEAEWLQRRRGVLVRLQRPQAQPVADHPSEQHTDGLFATAALHNDSLTLAGLHERIDELMAQMGISRRPREAWLDAPLAFSGWQRQSDHVFTGWLQPPVEG